MEPKTFKGKPYSYYEGLDKRTKEYKDFSTFIKNGEKIDYKQEKGAGDLVEEITKATGIKFLVKKLFGEDCGCEDRKKKMNSNPKLRFFSKRRGNELTPEEFIFLKEEYFNLKQGEKHTLEQVHKLQDIYKRVFNEPNKRYTTCPSCIRNMSNNLKLVLDYYLKEV